MDKIKIIGGNQLNGKIYISGAKNAALPLICSSLLTEDKVILKNGFQKIRFHDLRHSCASFLYDKGWGIKDIQTWLGHSDIQKTTDIYTYISNSRKKILAKDLEGTFSLE